MTPHIQKKLRQPRSREPLHVTHRHAAGIDVHANVHWIAVPPEDAPPAPANHPPHLPAHVRSFGTCTADLMALANWLTECGVKTIAMESTGIRLIDQPCWAKATRPSEVSNSRSRNPARLVLLALVGITDLSSTGKV